MLSSAETRSAARTRSDGGGSAATRACRAARSATLAPMADVCRSVKQSVDWEGLRCRFLKFPRVSRRSGACAAPPDREIGKERWKGERRGGRERGEEVVRRVGRRGGKER